MRETGATTGANTARGHRRGDAWHRTEKAQLKSGVAAADSPRAEHFASRTVPFLPPCVKRPPSQRALAQRNERVVAHDPTSAHDHQHPSKRARCSWRDQCLRLLRQLQLRPARRPARETARPLSARRGAALLTAEAGASAGRVLSAPRHLRLRLRGRLRRRRLRALALPRWRAMPTSRAARAGAVRRKVLHRSV